MTESEIAWLAGLLEGEGYFGWTSNKNGIRITVGMTDEDTINKIKRIAGGNIIGVKELPERKPVYTWHSSVREDVIEILNAILPHMSERRTETINLMLAWNKQFPKGGLRKDSILRPEYVKRTNVRHQEKI